MELVVPPRNDEQLLDWWLPLVTAARLGRIDDVPWTLNIDEFELLGWFKTSRRTITAYRHLTTRCHLFCDINGGCYRWIPYRSGRAGGRFAEITVRTAIHQAGISRIGEPARYPTQPLGDSWVERLGGPPHPSELAPPAPGGGRHLRLVPGGG